MKYRGFVASGFSGGGGGVFSCSQLRLSALEAQKDAEAALCQGYGDTVAGVWGIEGDGIPQDPNLKYKGFVVSGLIWGGGSYTECPVRDSAEQAQQDADEEAKSHYGDNAAGFFVIEAKE